LSPSSYWRLCNFDFCAACPMNSEAKILISFQIDDNK
jgi:hypothetical protein